MQWTFCNTTAETQKISEIPLSDHTTLNFHQLAILISFSTGSAAIALSLGLIWMHALNYTKPAEQRNIIRILLMVPIYAASNFLQLVFYHHAVYYEVISDCYEAFAISSFFSLMCQYMAPTLHEQKHFFRQLSPIKPWVAPVNWFAKCCGGDRGPWRTPKSGLTWFNIIWIGVYHYCFIRVSMTIVAVVTQHYKVYCESSMSPMFSHVWVLAVESVAVAIAMYCVIQYYVQFKVDLAYHKPGLKVLAIKGVIFLSFWQSTAISMASSWLSIIKANSKLAYPDISTGIPALLLSVEMFMFAILHIWAYPWQPYRVDAPQVFYPAPNANAPTGKLNEAGPPQGGFLGLWAIVDALNFWDVIKAFGRGLRWLFVGVKRRKEDISYQKNAALVDMDGDGKDTNDSYALYPYRPRHGKSTDHLPIAGEFRRSTYGMNQHSGGRVPAGNEEGAGLIAHAADPRYRGAASRFQTGVLSTDPQSMSYQQQTRGYPPPPPPPHQQYAHPMSAEEDDDYVHVPEPRVNRAVMQGREEGASQVGGSQSESRPPPDDTQRQVGAALWGSNPHQHPDGPMI
ncbi:hypothetical protein N0V93_007385 [Gnomoniopsis smithogilvyi]|uniref:Uncharacterized protein n=1 Tax=Gnomoniopsis smithogilvyi TaxID=1191159 RepID=A0A9W9CVB7_9PEZI|nr:hypothetical protein N0V93_007385 [Gnomoniopsis smithogilvyi]